jgi:hypothetical protein
MTVSPRQTIVARTVPATTPKVVPITPQREKRLRLMDGIVTAGCELIALAERCTRVFTAVNAHDAACDQAVARIDRLAHITAIEAEALGDTRLLDRMGLIRKQCAAYRTSDAGEDAGVSKIRMALGRIVLIAYGLNRRLTAELSKRASAKGRHS